VESVIHTVSTLNVKHRDVGKRSKLTHVDTMNNKSAVIVTRHYPEMVISNNIHNINIQPKFGLHVNMPVALIYHKNKFHANVIPEVINPEKVKDPEDVIAIEDIGDEDVRDDTAEISDDEDDDLDGIQYMLNLDVSDDEDAEDIDDESIHKRVYNVKD
jgi:hypothetical protein